MNVGMNTIIKDEEGKITFVTAIPNIGNRKTKKGVNSFFKASSKKKFAVFLQLTESQKILHQRSQWKPLKSCNAESTALSCR